MLIHHALLDTLKASSRPMYLFDLCLETATDTETVERVLGELVAEGEVLCQERRRVGRDREYLARTYTLRRDRRTH